MIKEDVLQYLKVIFYIIQQDTGWIISNKLTRELGIPSSNTISLATNTKVVDKVVLKPALATKEFYKQFIINAEVPSKIETNSGAFWANRYSEPGFKAFKKVFDNPSINRTILLASTKWYYAQTRTARKMIGNYFIEGIWESCYDDFVRARKSKSPSDTLSIQAYIAPKIVDENASNMEAG